MGIQRAINDPYVHRNDSHESERRLPFLLSRHPQQAQKTLLSQNQRDSSGKRARVARPTPLGPRGALLLGLLPPSGSQNRILSRKPLPRNRFDARIGSPIPPRRPRGSLPRRSILRREFRQRASVVSTRRGALHSARATAARRRRHDRTRRRRRQRIGSIRRSGALLRRSDRRHARRRRNGEDRRAGKTRLVSNTSR